MHHPIKFFFLIFLGVLASFSASAQVQIDSVSQDENRPHVIVEDTVSAPGTSERPFVTADAVDTTLVEDTSEEFSPRKASLYSAILPGLGQAYNKKYWKIPLIYGGIVGLGLVVDFYADNYSYYRRMLLLQQSTGANPTGASERVLDNAVVKSRRERDFYIIMCGLAYIINIVDAHIDAHLKGFDISDDLTLKMKPSLNSTAFNTPVGGIGIALHLK